MFRKLELSVVLIILLAIFSTVTGATEKATIEIGKPILSFKGMTVTNETFDLAETNGKVVIVNFWASWCLPCRTELPFFVELFNEFKARGFEIIAVNIDTKVDNARQFMKKTPLPFTVVLDTEQAIVSLYKPEMMPSSYVVDRKGMVHSMHKGFSKSDQEMYRLEIDTLLGPVSSEGARQ